MADTPTCNAGDRCRGYNAAAKPPHAQPLMPGEVFCPRCLDTFERDVRALLWDYLDLEQLQIPVLSQALNTQPAGKPAPPMPLNAAAEALQAEILYVTTAWEAEVRSASGLPPAPDERHGPAAPWHTTASNPPPRARIRPGGGVQRAVAILTPRLERLAGLPPVAMYRSGPDGDVEDVAGWEAVMHLSRLHQRARGMLGRTRRTTTVPGSCSGVDPRDDTKTCGGALYRDEPRFEKDPCPVYCGTCDQKWTTEEYERFVGLTLILGPDRPHQDAA